MRLEFSGVPFPGAGVDADDPGVNGAHGLGRIAGMGWVVVEDRTDMDADGGAEAEAAGALRRGEAEGGMVADLVVAGVWRPRGRGCQASDVSC